MTLYFSGFAGKEAQANDRLGFLLTPEMGNLPTNLSTRPWGADTGCFTLGDTFSLGKYISWLEKMRPYQATCCFATAPDVVGNAKKTWVRSRYVLPLLKQMGWIPALVAQNGIERMLDDIDWSQVGALFIGGTTRWKTSPIVEWLIQYAKSLGLWVHMGRVNSWTRFWRAIEMGCDSVDGTFLTFGPSKNTERLNKWLDSQERLQVLWPNRKMPRPMPSLEPIAAIFDDAQGQLARLHHRLAMAQQQLSVVEQAALMDVMNEIESLQQTLVGWNESFDELELAS